MLAVLHEFGVELTSLVPLFFGSIGTVLRKDATVRRALWIKFSAAPGGSSSAKITQYP